jgi:hypothetical protein
MNSIKVNLMFWLAGLTAGVMLMERWRRHGGRYLPVEPAPPATSTESFSSAPAGKPKMSTMIVTGAKSDVDRIRRLITK